MKPLLNQPCYGHMVVNGERVLEFKDSQHLNQHLILILQYFKTPDVRLRSIEIVFNEKPIHMMDDTNRAIFEGKAGDFESFPNTPQGIADYEAYMVKGGFIDPASHHPLFLKYLEIEPRHIGDYAAFELAEVAAWMAANKPDLPRKW